MDPERESTMNVRINFLHEPIGRTMVRSINEIGHLTGRQTIAEWAAIA
jgi:hypothetical protein